MLNWAILDCLDRLDAQRRGEAWRWTAAALPCQPCRCALTPTGACSRKRSAGHQRARRRRSRSIHGRSSEPSDGGGGPSSPYNLTGPRAPPVARSMPHACTVNPTGIFEMRSMTLFLQHGQPVMLNRRQRRAMHRLAPNAQAAIASDRAYFERRPDRQHRIRHTFRGETNEGGVVLDHSPATVPAGMARFTLVKNLRPGLRSRIFVFHDADAETEVDEATARGVFEACLTETGTKLDWVMAAFKGVGK